MLWEKEKLLIMSNLSFSHGVFKGLVWPVFPVKFQLWGFVPLTTEKWGYKEKNRGTKQN